jgi:hypothetical protein
MLPANGQRELNETVIIKTKRREVGLTLFGLELLLVPLFGQRKRVQSLPFDI